MRRGSTATLHRLREAMFEQEGFHLKAEKMLLHSVADVPHRELQLNAEGELCHWANKLECPQWAVMISEVCSVHAG